MEFPVKKQWAGIGNKLTITFDDYYSGTNKLGDRVVLTVPCTDYRWVDVEEEVEKPIELNMPVLNKGSGWYVSEKNSGLFLRPDGRLLNSTGWTEKTNAGYWDTYEEALEAKEAYENKNKVELSKSASTRGDGGTTSYYQLPEDAKELGDLIYHKEMNHSIGEAFCALYRLKDNGEYARNLRKAKYYIDLELSRVDG